MLIMMVRHHVALNSIYIPHLLHPYNSQVRHLKGDPHAVNKVI